MEKRPRKSAKLLDLTISYQTLPSPESNDTKEQLGSSGNLSAIGPPVAHPAMPRAKDAAVDIIANAPIVIEPPGIPTEHEMEIYRLRRRVAELECIVKDRDGRVVRALALIEDELQMWRTLLHQHVKETLGEIQARVLRLESVMGYLKDKESHYWPPLETPARWRSDK